MIKVEQADVWVLYCSVCSVKLGRYDPSAQPLFQEPELTHRGVTVFVSAERGRKEHLCGRCHEIFTQHARLLANDLIDRVESK